MYASNPCNSIKPLLISGPWGEAYELKEEMSAYQVFLAIAGLKSSTGIYSAYLPLMRIAYPPERIQEVVAILNGKDADTVPVNHSTEGTRPANVFLRRSSGHQDWYSMGYFWKMDGKWTASDWGDLVQLPIGCRVFANLRTIS